MRLVVQRVSMAAVFIDGREVGRISSGLLLFVGFNEGDNADLLHYMGEKLVNMRIFPDSEDKMNLSLLQLKKQILLVPQFTLYADCRKGNRPGFSRALSPDKALNLFDKFTRICEGYDVFVARGVFGASMQVELINDGPVTILLDSEELRGRV